VARISDYILMGERGGIDHEKTAGRMGDGRGEMAGMAGQDGKFPTL